MKRKILSVVLVFALVISIFAPINTIKAEAAKDEWNFKRYGDEIDVNAKLKEVHENNVVDRQEIEKLITSGFNEEQGIAETENEEDFTFNGGTRTFWGLDDYNVQPLLGNYYFKDYTLRGIGDNVEVWVANDLGFHDYVGPGEDSDDSYERPAQVVTQEQVDMVVEEFDNNIYNVDTEFFGTPDSHDGSESIWEGYYSAENLLSTAKEQNPDLEVKERIIILVDNVRDDQYYDPDYPFYIAGFYSPTYELYLDRNIINLDSKWWHYKFPVECDNPDPEHQQEHDRLQNDIYGTLAHEFQHLIHADNDNAEETWINEGMSDFAMYLCGYGHDWGHVNYFLDHPENSLVLWGDYDESEILSDYGQAYLMQLYLYDHYGKEFVRTLALDETQGIESVNKILDEFDTGIDFNELFKRFTVAVAIDNPEPEDGIYNFDSIDIEINYESAKTLDKDGVPAWGGDYKEIDHANKIQTIKFDGIDFLSTPWQVVDDPHGSDNKVLWGTTGHEIDKHLIMKADLSNVESATLKFDNFVEIEEQWDFGMVQVSTDNGLTWTSLANENTRDDIVEQGYPTIRENLPGFTGYYENWMNEEFDLTPYVGEEVLITFRYMTDWGYNDPGWFIDNIEIPEIGYSNDCSSTEGFFSIEKILQNDEDRVKYAVTFINEKSLGKGNNKQNYRVLNIDPFSISEAEALQLKEFFSGGNNYMVIWFAAPVGTKGTADYEYEITTKSDYNKDKKDKKNKK